MVHRTSGPTSFAARGTIYEVRVRDGAAQMPELPEVETIKNDLVAAGLCTRTIQSVDIFWHRTLAVPSLQEFQKQVVGAKIVDISRRGKYLIFKIRSTIYELHQKERSSFLIMHLRMSGKIDLKESSFGPRKHDRARLVFENGTQLLFHDTRKFGRWYFVDDAEKLLASWALSRLIQNLPQRGLLKSLKARSEP